MASPSLESRAQDFAARAHADQFRKYTHEPYIMHPLEVARLVRSVPHTEEMLAAAWLHDVVEDTAVTSGGILANFGVEVAVLVGWLTDVSKLSDGNRAARKAIDRAHTADAPPSAKTIKLADLIDNSRSIVEHDPKFAKVYLEEKRLPLPFLKAGDATLWAMAERFVNRAADRLLRTIDAGPGSPPEGGFDAPPGAKAFTPRGEAETDTTTEGDET